MDRRVSLRAEPASVTPSPARIPMAWPDCRRAPAVVDSSPPASACKVRAAEIWPMDVAAGLQRQRAFGGDQADRLRAGGGLGACACARAVARACAGAGIDAGASGVATGATRITVVVAARAVAAVARAAIRHPARAQIAPGLHPHVLVAHHQRTAQRQIAPAATRNASCVCRLPRAHRHIAGRIHRQRLARARADRRVAAAVRATAPRPARGPRPPHRDRRPRAHHAPPASCRWA